jgi:hypothetical protein
MLNIGHSPAQDVEVIPAFFFAQFSGERWYDIITTEQQRFCASMAGRKTSGAAQFLIPIGKGAGLDHLQLTRDQSGDSAL